MKFNNKTIDDEWFNINDKRIFYKLIEKINTIEKNQKNIIDNMKTVIKNENKILEFLNNNRTIYLEQFKNYTREEILQQRKEKFLSIGKQSAFTVFSMKPDWRTKDNFFISAKQVLFKFRKVFIIVALLLFSVFLFLF